MAHQTNADATRSSAAEIVSRLIRFEGSAGAMLEQVLAAQCRLGRAEAAAIIRPGGEGGAEVLGVHPLPPANPDGQRTLPAWLARALQQIRVQGVGGQAAALPLHDGTQLYGQAAKEHIVTLPMRGEGGSAWLGLYLLTTRDPAAVESSLERLELTEPLFALYDTRRMTREKLEGVGLMNAGIEVLTAVNNQKRFRAAAMAFCNEVHTRWGTQRVSVGFLTGRSVKLRAMSHTEHINRKMKLVQDLEGVMEESVDQEVEIAWPCPPEAMVVTRSAERLAKDHGPLTVATFPLWRGGKVIGAVTIERDAERPMTTREVEGLRLACNICGPPLMELYENDRWFGAKLAAGTRRMAATAVGPEHTWLKLGAVAGAIFLAVITLGRGADRVSAPFVVEATQRQIVSAPFDGYLKTVHVSPGDEVRPEDTELAELETAELRLQLARLRADRLQAEKKAAMERRSGKIVEQQIADAEAARVLAEERLVEHQIEMASIMSPMGGIVLEGDLKRRVGGSVSKGDILFEVVPTEGLRAELMVPEDRVTELAVGDRGELASAANPGDYIGFTVDKIEPLAEVVEAQNVFKVRATLDRIPPWLRPGMEGVAKVDVGRASFLWLWTRDAVNWVRMKLWW